MGHTATKFEKKAKKALLRLGLQEMSNIKSAKINMSGGMIDVEHAEAYSAGPKTLVLFGAWEFVDPSEQARKQAAGEFQNPLTDEGATPSFATPDETEGEASTSAVAESHDFPEEDIKSVMDEANVSREVAIKALAETEGHDPIEAILAVSMG